MIYQIITSGPNQVENYLSNKNQVQNYLSNNLDEKSIMRNLDQLYLNKNYGPWHMPTLKCLHALFEVRAKDEARNEALDPILEKIKEIEANKNANLIFLKYFDKTEYFNILKDIFYKMQKSNDFSKERMYKDYSKSNDKKIQASMFFTALFIGIFSYLYNTDQPITSKIFVSSLVYALACGGWYLYDKKITARDEKHQQQREEEDKKYEKHRIQTEFLQNLAALDNLMFILNCDKRIRAFIIADKNINQKNLKEVLNFDQLRGRDTKHVSFAQKQNQVHNQQQNQLAHPHYNNIQSLKNLLESIHKKHNIDVNLPENELIEAYTKTFIIQNNNQIENEQINNQDNIEQNLEHDIIEQNQEEQFPLIKEESEQSGKF